MKETKPTYKKQGNITLFDSDETMEKLNSMGNPLDKLSKAVDFEMFRITLERGLYKEKFTKVGAKPYDYVLMFKIVVLQRIYHLSESNSPQGQQSPSTAWWWRPPSYSDFSYFRHLQNHRR
jgi:hypothetical protein